MCNLILQYIKDAQGNIIAILDSYGNAVVEYNYDAWGNNNVGGTSVTLGNLNPFRYRGYYYDTETKLYFLQTRYYDPEVGRFINIDNIDYIDPETINGLNLYAYCNNNPVMNVDPDGTWSWKGFWKVVGAVLVVAAVTAAVVVTAGAAAVAVGAGAATVSAVMTGAAIGGGIAGTCEIINQANKNGVENINIGSVAIETFTGSVVGSLSSVGGVTTSATVRTGVRFAKVGLAGLASALHGINEGKSFDTIVGDAGLAMAGSMILQSFGYLGDKITGKTSSDVLASLKLDGKLYYGLQTIFGIGVGLGGRAILRFQSLNLGIIF